MPRKQKRYSSNNEMSYSKTAYKYTSIKQVPAHTIATIRKALAGGWVDKISVNSRPNTSRIRGMYPEISPRCIDAIVLAYISEINCIDPESLLPDAECSKILMEDRE